MKSTLLGVLLLMGLTPAVQAVERIETRYAAIGTQPVHLTPVLGVASFNAENTVSTNNFDRGFAGGVLADLGTGSMTFQTGVMALSTDAQMAETPQQTVSVQSVAVPLFAKFNLSGQPRSGVYAKAGAVPMMSYRGDNRLDVLAAGGVGGTLALSEHAAVTLDGTVNRMLTGRDELLNYNGVIVLGGLVVSM